MPNKNPKHLRVKLNYAAATDKDVAAQAVAVVDGLTNNPDFTNAPVDPAVFKRGVETYASAIAAALVDGGKKAIVDRRKHREVVVKMLRQLGHWVEANCKDDLSILKSSGFQPVSTTRTPVQPLPGPTTIARVDHGPNSGELLVKVKPLPKALSYMLRYAAIGADGKQGPWTELMPLSNSRSFSVKGLTPGTNYAFQVRALGRLGYTDWSDTVTRISM